MTSITNESGVIVRIADDGPRGELVDAVADVDCRAVEVGPTGVSGIEPLAAVTRGGTTVFCARCTPARLTEVTSAFVGDPASAEDLADAVVEHDPDVADLPTPDLPGFDVGVRSVLGACGWRRPTSPDDHEAAGGFVSTDSADVLDAGADLRGRGWGDWCHDRSVEEAWRAVRDADETGVVVVNAHGDAADSLLLRGAPFEMLEGAEAVADAVGADRVVVYAAEGDDDATETVREAAENYPDPPVGVDVVAGPAAYRAAEPTMAIEAVEGNDRLEARTRPPGPESFGVDGRPTLVHTPRTFAHLAVSLREGGLPATRLLTVTGDVDAPATVELPESATLDAALDAVDVDGEFKAACVGDRFGGLTRSLDVAADPESLSAADLGTEGVVRVLSTDRCVVEFVGRRAEFASDGNCGRCVPCREGTTQLTESLREIYDGAYDRDGIEELVRVMTASSICSFGRRAGRPARTAMTEFEAEFEAHADGRCPAGSCLEPMEAT